MTCTANAHVHTLHSQSRRCFRLHNQRNMSNISYAFFHNLCARSHQTHHKSVVVVLHTSLPAWMLLTGSAADDVGDRAAGADGAVAFCQQQQSQWTIVELRQSAAEVCWRWWTTVVADVALLLLLTMRRLAWNEPDWDAGRLAVAWTTTAAVDDADAAVVGPFWLSMSYHANVCESRSKQAIRNQPEDLLSNALCWHKIVCSRRADQAIFSGGKTNDENSESTDGETAWTRYYL